MKGMSIERARAELQAAMSGPAGRYWGYTPAVSTLLAALEKAEHRIAELISRVNATVPVLPEEVPNELRDEIIDLCDGYQIGDFGAQEIWTTCRATILQSFGNSEQPPEPVADVVAWRKKGEERTCDIRWRRFDVAPGPLFTRPLPPGLQDGYCIMPLKLTAANGAKAALSGEFHVNHHIVCEECAGEGCESCNEEGGWEGEILIGWDTIKRIHEAAVEACALPKAR